MKKRIIFLFMAAVSLVSVITGCTAQLNEELNLIDRRIASLEDKVQIINDNISSLKLLVNKLNEYDFVTNVEPLYQNASIAGYTISFSNSDPVTIYDGQNASNPVIGFAKGEDGLYYWTVSYEEGKTDFILDNYGQKVSATTTIPQLKIEQRSSDKEYFWYVTYDNGEIWYELDKARGTDGKSFISNIDVEDDYYTFNFVNGTSVKLMSWDYFSELKSAVAAVDSNQTALTALVKHQMEDNLYTTDIVPVIEGQDTLGYHIFMSDGTSFPVYNGRMTNMPEFAFKLNPSNPTDSTLYWAVKNPGDSDFQLVTYQNEIFRANPDTAIIPMLDISKDGGHFWWVISYDGGNTVDWLLDEAGNKVMVDTAVPNNPVSALKDEGSYIDLTIFGQHYYLLKYEDIDIRFDTTRIKMSAQDAETVNFTVPSGSQYEFLVNTVTDGFKADVEMVGETAGIVSIVSPVTFTSGKASVSILVSDGKGTMKTFTISILFE